jgi:hypothetical protein
MSIISQFSGGGVKSVQSGTASVAGTTTIVSVDVTKSVVYSVSKGSTVTAANGTITPNSTANHQNLGAWAGTQAGYYGGGADSGQLLLTPITLPSLTVPGVVSAVTAKQFSARLTNATTVTVDGACEWQVVEYY